MQWTRQYFLYGATMGNRLFKNQRHTTIQLLFRLNTNSNLNPRIKCSSESYNTSIFNILLCGWDDQWIVSINELSIQNHLDIFRLIIPIYSHELCSFGFPIVFSIYVIYIYSIYILYILYILCIYILYYIIFIYIILYYIILYHIILYYFILYYIILYYFIYIYIFYTVQLGQALAAVLRTLMSPEPVPETRKLAEEVGDFFPTLWLW